MKNRLSFIKSIFKKKKNRPSEVVISKEENIYFYPYVDCLVNTSIPDPKEDIIELIYQNKLNDQIINQYLNYQDISNFGNYKRWHQKGKLNFPGPFYTDVSDSCGTGVIEAPNNVIFDENCMEYVMIQPRTREELYQLCNAAIVEIFDAYNCDGNEHWTFQLVKEWWRGRDEIFEQLKNEELIKMNYNQEMRYVHYLENEAEMDLRRYCYFLENGVYPKEQSLPEIN